MSKVTIVFPAYNEGKTIAQVVNEAKKSKYSDEILVIDGYSKDNTVTQAKAAGANVVLQYKDQYPGKGIAIKTARDVAKGDILVFFDADITNFKAAMLDKLVEPIIKGGYDHTIANFVTRKGRVTELVVKPLFKIFFPEVKYSNPLAGEFAIKKTVLQSLDIPEDWGVETSLTIDISVKGYNSLEVDFTGSKKHDSKPVEDLIIMSKQILNTMFAKIIEHKRMIRGVEKTNKIPENWISNLKKEVVDKTDEIEIEIDEYFTNMKEDFCKMDDELYRIGTL